MSLNKVMLIGNVGKDPEIRYLAGNGQNGSNSKVATFTLATTERFRDRNGNPQERTEWHNIVAWRNNADIIEKYVKKGTQLYIEGKLRTRDWTDQNGNKRYTTEINVDNLQLLGRKSDNPANQQAQATGVQPQQAQASQPQAPAVQPQYQAPSAQPDPMSQNQQPEAGDEPSDDLPF